jgi:phosphoribosylformimino-5-aminoimidazole carboxamide ribotide isomerase
MNFKVIPAIDLLDKKAVRLYQGDYSQVTVYNENPVDQIKEFTEAKASLIHLVDLNAARTGDRTVNGETIARIAEYAKGKCSLELGGGIRSHESIKHYFSLGIDRAILGTAALRDPAFLKEAIDEYGAERIIVGVDAKDGIVKVDGWEGDGGMEVFTFLKKMEDTGVREVIFTDIKTDGTLKGPAVDAIKDILARTKLRVIASGGVGSLDDLKKLKSLNNARLVGAIAGKAIYEKRFELKDAIAELRL